MLVVMEKTATPEQIEHVVKIIEEKGYTPRPIPGGERVAIGVLRNKGAVDAALFIGIPGVKDIIPITRPYKLVSRETQPEDTIITVGGVTIGNGHLTIMAGPCAVESEIQALTIARKRSRRPAPTFSGAGPSSRAPPPIPSRGWARRGSRSWPRSARSPACPSSRR